MKPKKYPMRKKRKFVQGLHFEDLTELGNYKVIGRKGEIVNVSEDGFALSVDRENLSKDFRYNLSLEGIVGKRVAMYISEMDLDLDGVILRATHVGKGVFYVVVRFSDEFSSYWKMCFMDMIYDDEEM